MQTRKKSFTQQVLHRSLGAGGLREDLGDSDFGKVGKLKRERGFEEKT